MFEPVQSLASTAALLLIDRRPSRHRLAGGSVSPQRSQLPPARRARPPRRQQPVRQSAAPSAQGSTPAGSPTSSAAPFTTTPGDVTIVAYSTPKSAYDAIIPLFQATPDGTGVNFEESYGASGDQSRAVAAGLPADYVAFSLSPDIDRLVKASMVAADWNSGANKGMVTDSVVVLAVRRATPRTSTPGTTCSSPASASSRPTRSAPAARAGTSWPPTAHGSRQGLTEQQATANLTKLFQNVLVQDTSGRNATQTFLAGQGDVLISYENEAIAAKQGGQDLDYVVPDSTILIENPAAVTTVGDATDKAKAFLSFVLSQRRSAGLRRPRLPAGQCRWHQRHPTASPSRRRQACSRSTIWAAGPPSAPSSSTRPMAS